MPTHDLKCCSLLAVPYANTACEVQVWTLDRFDRQMGCPNRILLWLDVEGSELSALRSGSRLLASGRVRWINPVLDRYCVRCHPGREPGSAEPNLAFRPGHSVFKEPYLTLVGPAGWGNPVAGGQPGYGIAGAIPVESNYGQNDPGA